MATFEFTFTDPETGEKGTEVKEFEGTPSVTAREWAEDYIYGKVDKHAYGIKELTPAQVADINRHRPKIR